METITVNIDGCEKDGTLNGNNAAWLCDCGYEKPLIWSAGIDFEGAIECPCCKSQFIGDAKERGQKPRTINKINSNRR